MDVKTVQIEILQAKKEGRNHDDVASERTKLLRSFSLEIDCPALKVSRGVRPQHSYIC